MSVPSPIIITKASGEQVPFDIDKLKASLHRSGASEELSNTIAEELQPRITPGLSTRKLYRMAFDLLRKRSRSSAARYRLKQAIMDLGPSGFPFERFVARILEHDGYQTQVGLVVQGRCVAHEVDVIAEKGSHRYLVECKYHNTRGRVNDVKVPLYIQARFLDVEEQWRKAPGNSHKDHLGWVITNTRFTADALAYGQCVGLRMVGWDQAGKDSLKERIDRSGLYPLTCLGSLTKAEKERLLMNGLVLASDLVQQPKALAAAMVKTPRMANVLKEAENLCAALPT